MLNSNILRTIDVFLEGAQKPLIVILGPTAAGKTAVSLEVAKYLEGVPPRKAARGPSRNVQRSRFYVPRGLYGHGREGALRGEIVNADSRQIYKYLDIGTAKIAGDPTSPVPAGRGWVHGAWVAQGIVHHLIDVKDPKEEVTVGWYQAEALKTIDAILARERAPLLVGGSMLYVSSIIDGLTLAPAADPILRARLEAEYERDKGKALSKRLQSIDPNAAAAIHPGNKVYVVRAVEIYETLKQPKSRSVQEKKFPYDLLILGVTCPRGELQKRIEARVEDMFARGWLQEVRDLLARGYEPSDPGMRSLGYREICQFLKEAEDSEEAEDLEEMRAKLKQRIVTKTRQYAKRQMSWWRNDKRIHWITLSRD